MTEPQSREAAEPAALAALTKRWVETWKRAGFELERIRRDELRQLDVYRAIELLCGEADYTCPPRAPRPTSGLIEQQRYFRLVVARDRGP